jgi:hypothetical protein
MGNPLSYCGSTSTSVIIDSNLTTTDKIMLIVARIIYKKVSGDNNTSSSVDTNSEKFISLYNDMSEMDEFKSLAESLMKKYKPSSSTSSS